MKYVINIDLDHPIRVCGNESVYVDNDTEMTWTISEGGKKKLKPLSEEVTPHKNYKYLSDYWCECGNHLGKKGSVTFCSDCGRKVKWDANRAVQTRIIP